MVIREKAVAQENSAEQDNMMLTGECRCTVLSVLEYLGKLLSNDSKEKFSKLYFQKILPQN